MTSRLQELRIERDACLSKMSAITNMTDEDYRANNGRQEFDKADKRLKQIDIEIDALNRQIQGATPDWRNSDGQGVKVLRNAADIRAHYANTARDAGARDPIQIGDFLRGVAGMRTTDAVQAALSVGTDTGGGYMVPFSTMPQVLEKLQASSAVLRAGAGIVPLEQGAKSFTTAAVSVIPTAAWREENGDLAESAPAFRGIVAAPKSLAFFFKVSRELLADAPNINQVLTTTIGQSFARELDRAALLGSGTGPEPRGLANLAPAGDIDGQPVHINLTPNGAPVANVHYDPMLDALQTMVAFDAPPPTAALMSPSIWRNLAEDRDLQGNWLGKPPILDQVQFIPTPVIRDDYPMGTTPMTSKVFMGDFSQMAFMMREQVSIQVANELFATKGQIGFICHVRADIAVWYAKAFSVIHGVKYYAFAG